MRKFLLILILLLGLPVPLMGQRGNTVIRRFVGVPTGPCTFIMLAIDLSTGDLYDCDNGSWNKIGPGAAGAVEWDSINSPSVGNQSLTMANFLTDWVWGTATGTSTMFDIRDTTGNTGTGYVFSVSTAGTSTAKPIRITIGGLVNGVEMNTSAVLQAIGTGSILADDLQTNTIAALTDFNSALCGTNEILEDQGASWACIATPSGGGLTHTVNGSALASSTAVDFDDTTPAAPASSVNLNWRKDALDPTNISINLLLTDIDGVGIGVSGTELILDNSELTANQTFWTGASASRTLTFSLSGATDPVVTLADGVFNLTTGTLQQNGDDVIHKATNTLLSTENVILDGSTNPRDITLGIIRILQTPNIDSTRGIAIITDAAGFGDTKALEVDWTATGVAAGDFEAVIDLDIDTANSSGGVIIGLEITETTTGSATTYGMLTGVGINPILNEAGVFGNVETAFTFDSVFTDVTADFNSTASDVQMFVSNGDLVYIGMAAMFDEVEFILAVTASNAGIQPTFEYSDGATGWITFSPTDNTNGMRQNGDLVWIATSLAGWAQDTVNSISGKFWIRITRGAVTVATPPTEDLVQVNEDLDFMWDSSGNLNIASLSSGFNQEIADSGFIRVANDEDFLCAERATPGTDVCVHLNTGDDWEFQSDIAWHSGTAFIGTLTHANTADRAYDYPDADGEVSLLGQTIDLASEVTGVLPAGSYGAASIDGDDINSNLAGTGLTLTGASPDTLDCDVPSTSVVGCPELATEAETTAGTDTGRVNTPAGISGPVQDGDYLECLDGEVSDTYVCSMTPALTAYIVGMEVHLDANTANTGVASLNIDTIGAITIVKLSSGIATTLADNDIRAGQRVLLAYDGTNFQMMSQLGNAGAADGVGYDEVLDEASGLTKRAQLNFTGAGVACVDNPGATRTDCDISGAAGNEFADNLFRVTDDGDNTAKLAFQVSPVDTATVRTVTVQNVDLEMAGTDIDNNFSVTQTFQGTIIGNAGGGGGLTLRPTGTSETVVTNAAGAVRHKFFTTSDTVHTFFPGNRLTQDQMTTHEFTAGEAITAGQLLKLDTTTAMDVLIATTSDTENIVGISRETVSAAAGVDVIVHGIYHDALLGTGTCSVGDYVIPDTTTNGRIKCSATLPVTAIVGIAMADVSVVGDPVRTFVNVSINSVDGGGGGNVDLLDGSVHQDTAAGTAVQGDIITVPVSGNWTRFAVGTTLQFLGNDGTDVVWEQPNFTDLAGAAAAGQYGAATIDGDDINSNIAGTGLTLTAASPDTLDCDAASTTAVGCPEMAIASEVNTGTSTILAVTPDALAGSVHGQVEVQMVAFDFTTAVATGDGAFFFHIATGSKLIGMNLIDIVGAVITVSSSGAITVDLARCAPVATGNPCSGTVADVLSTNLTIDQNEDSSDTAAVDAVIDTANDDVIVDQMWRVDVDGAGTGTQGLLVTLIFQLP